MNKKENLLRTLKRDDPEWVPFDMESELFLVPPLFERAIAEGKDEWGVYWYDSGREDGTYPAHNGHTIRDIFAWREQISIPDIENRDWNNFTLSWDRLAIDWKNIDRNEHVITAALDFGVFERTYLLLGIEEALINIMAEPELVKELADAIADYNVRVVKKMCGILKPDLVRYGDDWGNQTQLMMPPERWREIFKPAVKKIYDAIHEQGAMVFQHSCGKIDDIFGDLIELGIDVFDPCQPCNDLVNMKRLYWDKVAFCGGIDSQHVLGRPGVTSGEVEQEVKKRIEEMSYAGGYVARPSHTISYEPYVMDAMRSAIEKYGQKPLWNPQKPE